MENIDNNAHLLALLKCDNIGPTKILKLINSFTFNEPLMDYEILSNFISNQSNTSFLQYLQYVNETKSLIEKSYREGIGLVTILDSNLFPEKLYSRSSNPIIHLFYRGNIGLLHTKSIAIIGSRVTADSVLEQTEYESSKLSKHGFTIVSGLALGVDTKAHEGCLNAAGNTIAVLPTALNSITPQRNKGLSAKIVKNNGLLLSEYPIGSDFNINHYKERDRIQSTLADVVLVPACAVKSGTMIAVRDAIKLGRPVYQFIDNNNPMIELNYIPNNDHSFNNFIESANAAYTKNLTKGFSQLSLC